MLVCDKDRLAEVYGLTESQQVLDKEKKLISDFLNSAEAKRFKDLVDSGQFDMKLNGRPAIHQLKAASLACLTKELTIHLSDALSMPESDYVFFTPDFIYKFIWG